MYQYKFDKDEYKKVMGVLDSETQANNDIVGKFGEVDSKYKSDYVLPELDLINLRRLDDVVIDQDAIKKQAENELSGERQSNIDKINENIANRRATLNDNIVRAKENAASTKNNLDDYYKERKQNASNEAIKRGLARSSIIINQLDAFDEDKLNRYMSIDNELTKSINDLNDQIESLSEERSRALNDYNISYATKLNDRINKLNDELNKQQKEVIKYNNEIAEAEAKYNANLIKQRADIDSKNRSDELDLATFIEKYGRDTLDENKYLEKYNIAMDILNNMDRTSAISELRNNAEYYKSQLGNKYYNLLAVMNSRL